VLSLRDYSQCSCEASPGEFSMRLVNEAVRLVSWFISETCPFGLLVRLVPAAMRLVTAAVRLVPMVSLLD
jgi:hypothetical protein